ncbi:MAG: MFS transporter [Ruminiclostridium sp.]|nr:MFS transporter [Ruminiclostridium sp.]
MKDENKKTRLMFIIDGALINAALVLTSGIFLSGYIVFLDGSDFLVGILNNSLTWTSVAALFSFLIFERMERRKKLLLALLIASRLLVCSSVFLPLIFGKGTATLGILTTMVIAGNVLWGVYAIGASVWMIGSFPKESRNGFVYNRIFWIRIFFTLFTMIMGFVLDWSGKSYSGFLIVFLTSMVLSLADVYVLTNIKEQVNIVPVDGRFKPRLFFEPLARKGYRDFLIFIFMFYSSLTISSSFTPLYLIRYLKFDYKFISIINVISYVFLIVCTGLWSRLESRKGLMFVFKLTGLIAIVEFLIYGFLKSDTYFLLYLAPVFSGIGYSGFNVTIFNHRYELMPENNRTVYEGWFGAVLGLSMLVSPVIGDFIMNRLPVFQNIIFQYSKFQLMYFISFILAVGVVLFALKDSKC